MEGVMGKRRFRVNVMKDIETWWCVEEKRWWGWTVIAPRLKSLRDAEAIIYTLRVQR